VGGLGCRGGVVRTAGLRLPLGHKFYDPIYREAENLGCALAVHGTNGADELASGAFETFTEVHTVSFPVGMFVQFSNMIYQGVPARFPKWRLAFLEIGSTWLPYWLDRMDEHWEKRGEIETPALKQRPSDCGRTQPRFFSLLDGWNVLTGNVSGRWRESFRVCHRYSTLGLRVPGEFASHPGAQRS